MGVLETLATIANIGDNHWMALILDFKSLTILYGDSTGGTIDEDTERALTWWIQHHTGKLFTTSCLPITRQQDSHSCGILAWVALAAFLFPERYALVEARVVADERLRMFLRVADRHNEMVRSNCDLRDLVTNENQSFEANSERCPFTFRASNPGSSDDNIEISESSPPPPCEVTVPPCAVTLPPRATAPPLQTVSSSIRNAFSVSKEAEDLCEEPKFGLLKFFSKGTTEDKKAYFAREDERAENTRSINGYHAKHRDMDKKEHEREQGRLRQQKRRQLLKEQEIKIGARSPKGTKSKVRYEERKYKDISLTIYM